MGVFIIAEIGINHNGDIDIIKKLIDYAVKAGCDAVKFQKRTIDLCYSKEYLDSYRESRWGNTQRAQKEGIELDVFKYDLINDYCKAKGIEWFASAWDLEAQNFLNHNYDLKYNKIASAMLTNVLILDKVAREGKKTFISTGMSTHKEITEAISIFKKYNCPFELMHCNSTYPMRKSDANLKMIKTLKEIYHCDVGYSGHETGRVVSLGAVAMGATSIERHITLDRTMYGSDQSASLDVIEFGRLVDDIRTLESAFGDGKKRLTDDELKIRKKMRGY